MRLGESIVEERSIREAGQRIMKRLMGKLGREHALFGDVAFGNYEIQRLAGLVTGGDFETSAMIVRPSRWR